MTVNFVVLPYLFKLKSDKHKEELQEFIMYVFPFLYLQPKRLVFVSVQLF